MGEAVACEIGLCPYTHDFHRAKDAYVMRIAISWRALLASTGLVLLASACSDRERLNPIDPLNPYTQGKPVGLQAISMRDTVELRWQSLALRGLLGYRIYRRSANNAGFALIDSVSDDNQAFRNFGLALGLRHVYRIAAFSQKMESSPSDTVSITPGPAFTWVADVGSGAVVKLTHDGLHEIVRARNFVYPLRIQANAKSGQLWVIDSISQELLRLDASGRFSGVRTLLQRPVDLAVDSTENSVWVADSNLGILKLNSNGMQVAQVSLPGVDAVAFNYWTGELWALDGTRRKLWRIARNAATSHESETVLIRPRSISVDPTGAAWIADSTRVLRIHSGGQVDTAKGYTFSYARKVAVNQNNGECWAIDWSPRFLESVLVKFSASGDKLFSLANFSAPGSLSVNVFDGSCFITEPQLGRITHVSADGTIISRSNNVSAPTDVDVENRPLN